MSSSPAPPEQDDASAGLIGEAGCRAGRGLAGTAAPTAAPDRARIRVIGTVQGVGFRPHVYRLAHQLRLGGFVLNDARGVLIEVEGPPALVSRFLTLLQDEPPPLAVLESVSSALVAPAGEQGFEIRPSPRGQTAEAPVTPDTAICNDCLRELLDPADRRHRYPFINCTNCGPRFTIVTAVPYDRPFTTMASFTMCKRCQAEYDNPADRRFHAQPNACPDCGPHLSVCDAWGAVVHQADRDPVNFVTTALGAGQIVAVKGIGGFHLACRADDETAVARLRARKHREDKPFAVMVESVQAAGALVKLDPSAGDLLAGAERPIVLAPRRRDAPVAASVAPASTELGVMLPYTPLHHLLLTGVGCPLVMTSGNVSDEPIAFTDSDALQRLGPIADLFLLHDRQIQTRTDDSVVRPVGTRPARLTTLRRARGYVPASLTLPGAGTPRPLLACGAQLKNTFCVAKGRRAWLSHHIGDLENYETLRSFTDGIAHFRRLFAVDPEVVVHDLHPEYLSTKYALETGAELIGVQHHHAHLAACLAEHSEPGPAVGAIFDGSGYGTDGSVWGGELLIGDVGDFRRAGAVLPVPLPGGERAIREPWRMACAWLQAAGEGQTGPPATLGNAVPERDWHQVRRLAASGLASPVTTSIGRLFDAVAALCGVCPHVSYEGQAAIELEAVAHSGESGAYELEWREEAGRIVLDPRSAIRAILGDLRRATPVGTISAQFHSAVADATASACAWLARAEGTDVVVLSGGVFQNRRLLEDTVIRLERAALRTLIPQRLPPGDGGISFGQAAVAARRLQAEFG